MLGGFDHVSQRSGDPDVPVLRIRGIRLLGDVKIRECTAGDTLDEILHRVRIAPELLEKPYLRPVYDEPEFVVRNIWRLYGGWYDGNPANLKPAPATAFAREVAALAGGATALAMRSRTLAASDELRLACQLVELAAQAEPEDRAVHAARRDIYRLRRESELSLMARGIYGEAARQSAALAGDEVD